ncbi:putative ubiquitin-specific protease [Phytophthora cinnamomi]|uniref:putative ubiquitin-specific protease n=1 Tax=Phytophthora cinnamomi TaxID=4785 RepID=UPI00355A9A5E|nr:putative ubiquitin-specific protease [Phytophthora cinnamomi]
MPPLLVSTNVAVDKLLSLRVLLVHPELHCAGLVRLTQLTFQGLKRAKRWDALLAVSTQLLDAMPRTSSLLLIKQRPGSAHFEKFGLSVKQNGPTKKTAPTLKVIDITASSSSSSDDENEKNENQDDSASVRESDEEVFPNAQDTGAIHADVDETNEKEAAIEEDESEANDDDQSTSPGDGNCDSSEYGSEQASVSCQGSRKRILAVCGDESYYVPPLKTYHRS